MLYKGSGCDYCKGTGYQGRAGLFEVMLVNDEIREMIISEASVVELREKAKSAGMEPLFEDGIYKALHGLITLDEVSRVCEEIVEIEPKPQDISGIEVFKPDDIGMPGDNKIAPEDIDKYSKQIKEWISKQKKQEREGQ